MVAEAYARQRSELAKSLGLGQLRRERAAKLAEGAGGEPKRRGRPPKTVA
jgi:hypothetical protein